MSGNGDEEKLEAGKSYPLDLASKINVVKTGDVKAPLVIPGPPLRGMRLLTQTNPITAGQSQTTVPTIITTNIVPQPAVIKQSEMNRTQLTGIINQTQPQVSGNITLQRQAHITLATSLPVGQCASSVATYHVPRGPAVVANLSAPRSNVAASIRAPLVVTAQSTVQVFQGQSFVRPPRTPSPAQGTAWLTNAANGSQIKGAPTVLSSPVRGASVTGVGNKSQIVTRPQVGQVVSTIRPTTTILQSAIIGQGQLHPFKSGQGAPGIQTLNTTVTLAAQVVPNRSQTLVYSTGNAAHFTSTPRITVATTTVTGQRQQTTIARPMGQITATRLAVPVNMAQSTTRLVAPQGTVLTTGTRISTVANSQQSAVLGAAPTRILSTTQANVSLGRLTVTVTNPSNTTQNPLLTQIRSTLAMHPIVAASNTSQNHRTLHTQGAKVIAQPVQGAAIHLTQMPTSMKSTNNVTTSSRTITAQSAAIIGQRPGAGISTHAIPIAKVFPQQEAQQVVTPTNVFIQTPLATLPRRTSPGPTSHSQTTSTVPTTTVTTYSLASGTYFYDATGNYTVARSFGQQPTFTISQGSSRPSSQVHGIVSNHSMRFNPIMVVEPSKSQPLNQEPSQDNLQSLQTPTKMTSSPRPSILRKRDHEGSPLKAAKNLIPTLNNLQQPPTSPPSRPDSRNNGHSSGGSTTISATSSPGLGDANEDSMSHMPMNKEEEEENRPPLEMSPRKKPRKQNLAGNELDENNDDMQFISERELKKDQEDSDAINSDGPQDGAPESHRVHTVRKPASASLLNSYRHTWKTTNNHYLRYSDVRPKDERRPTIIDLANQHRVLDKVNGWKIHHLSTQMEDLADQEQTVHNQLTELLKYTESKEHNNSDLNRINELIKGNLQRIKIINDGMIEAKSQIMKIFDHKVHVADIISRCASKRNYKKREKS